MVSIHEKVEIYQDIFTHVPEMVDTTNLCQDFEKSRNNLCHFFVVSLFCADDFFFSGVMIHEDQASSIQKQDSKKR